MSDDDFKFFVVSLLGGIMCAIFGGGLGAILGIIAWGILAVIAAKTNRGEK